MLKQVLSKGVNSAHLNYPYLLTIPRWVLDHEVGAGPNRLRAQGIFSALEDLNVDVKQAEVDPLGDAVEGDIGRYFEVLRRTSRLVTEARNSGSFPIILAGNCGASIGVLAGLTGSEDLKTEAIDAGIGCIWFDAHDDFNVPDTVLSGYFDSMPIAIMNGQCWKALRDTIPGYKPMSLDKFIHCGLRELNDMERDRVTTAGYPVIWGSTEKKIDFANELSNALESRDIAPAMVHVDLDVLDASIGQVNKFPPAPGGLSEEDLHKCMRLLPGKVSAASLTIASFDPSYDPQHKISGIAIEGITTFVKSLLEAGLLATKKQSTT